MGTHGGRWAVIVWLLVWIVGLPSLSAIDAIGLRLLIPSGRVPFWVGPEVSFRTEYGYGRIALHLSPDGRTLMLGSADLRLHAEPVVGETLVRLTAGLYYFDPTHSLPSLLAGAGIAYRHPFGESFVVGLSGEFLYPLALPAPLFSVFGGVRWP